MKHKVLIFLQDLPLLFFFVTYPLGQLGAIPFGKGIQLYVHDIAVIILLLQYAFLMLYRKKHVQRAPVLTAWGIFLFLAGLSLLLQIFSVSSLEYVRGVLYFLRFAAYTAVTLVVLQDKQPYRWLLGLYISGVCMSIFGIFQLWYVPGLKPLVGAGWDEHYGRLFSTLYDPNFTGMILVLTLLAGFHYLISLKKSHVYFKKSWVWVFQFILVCSIIVTYSRSVYLACISSIFVFLLYTKKLKLFLFILMLGILLYVAIPKGSRDVNRITRGVSSIARIENWNYSLTLFLEKPIIGFGYNLLRPRIAQDKPLDTYGVISRDAAGVNSSVLLVFITTGIIGGISYLYWQFKQYVSFHQVKTVNIGIIGVSSFVGVFLFSLFNNGLFYPWIVLWMSILLGIALFQWFSIKKKS